jgi:Transaldolase/Fructose-6-phosphate aldolase
MPESGENQCLNGIARHFPALGILPQMPNSAFATKSLARIIARDILDSRTPTRYIDELLVTGLTSNPTIFDHAIRNSTHYDAAKTRARRVTNFAPEGNSRKGNA